MIRLTLIFVYVTALSAYAFKDWYRSLCGLIILMGVIQHPDVPKSILGVPGLNPWNLLLLFVLVAWLSSRRREGLCWDMPAAVSVPLILYASVALVSTLRLTANLAALRLEYTLLDSPPPTTSDVVSELWINTFKWVVPGLLLFDGCRDSTRFRWAVASVLGVYVLLAVQTIKWMPTGSIASGDALSHRALKIIQNEIGYSRVNLSMLLAGGSWATLAALPLGVTRMQKALIVIASLAQTYAQALTGGRMGYVTWGLVGLVLCGLRWRRYLLVAPLVVVAILAFVPAAQERMLQGFTSAPEDAAGDTRVDDYQVTSGRTLIWPYVIEKWGQAPLAGYGREAMVTTGLRRYLWTELGESFPHPHNAYLQLLLDCGWLGLVLVLWFYGAALSCALRLFMDERSPLFVTIGGIAAALILTLLVASFGSQSFYPREGAVGLWAAMMLSFRMIVQRQRASEGEAR